MIWSVYHFKFFRGYIWIYPCGRWSKVGHSKDVHSGRKWDLRKTSRKRPGRLLKVLYAFNLSPVPTGNGVEELLFFVDVIFCMALKWKRAISKSSYASDLLCGRDWASLLNIIPFLDSCHISWRKYFRK